MALSYGSRADTNVTVGGMSALIYNELDVLLSPPLQDAVDQAEGDAKNAAQNALDEARIGWQKLAFAVASGVVEHLLANLEIRGVETQGTVTIAFGGQTQLVNGHRHGPGTLTGTHTNATFTQSNDGTGRIA